MTVEVLMLPPSSVTVLGQLFTCGPTADDSIISKEGRAALVKTGLAVHAFGWAWLTEDGVRAAIEWTLTDLRQRNQMRWIEKLGKRR